MDAGECPFPPTCELPKQLPINRYPDPTADSLREAISSSFKLKRDNVVMTSGVDELIELATQIFSEPNGVVLSFEPTFSMYRVCADANGRKYESVSLTEKFTLQEEEAISAASKADVTFVCSPNNPTGTVIDRKAIEKVVDAAKGLVVIDEVYSEFAETEGIESCIDLVQQGAKNVLITRSFSKAYAAAGIRLGYGVACEEIIGQFLKTKLPYNINIFSQEAGLQLWQERSWMESNLRSLIQMSRKLANDCRELGCFTSDSITPFFVLQLPDGYSANDLREFLKEEFRIVVKCAGMINGRESLRINTGTPEQNKIFLSALSSFLKS